MAALVRVRVLIAGAEPAEVDALVAAMRQAGFDPTCRLVVDEQRYLVALDERPDVILAVSTAPSLPAARALKLLQARGLPIPFVVLAGPQDGAAVELLHQGAGDLLFRGDTARLSIVLDRALARKGTAIDAAGDARLNPLFEGNADAQAAPVGMCVIDEDGTFVRVNASYATLLGYHPDELVGQPLTMVFSPEAQTEAMAAYHLVLASSTEHVSQRILRRRDGTPIAALGASILVSGPDGRPQRAIFVLDFKERRRAEELGARLAAIVAGSSDAIIGTDFAHTADGSAPVRIITSWNASAERLYGYTAAEALGRSVAMLAVPGRDDDEIRITTALRTGEPIVDLDTVCRHQDGHTLQVSVSISPIRDARGTIIGAASIHRDITARRRAEDALARANADLETLFHVLPIGIGIATGADAAHIRMNPTMARMLGLPMEVNPSLSAPEGEQPTTFTLLHDGREPVLEELPIELAVATGQVVRDLELEIVRADGVRRTALTSAAPLFDEQGRVRGAVLALLDITERVNAERQRDMLLASMAHDLKNPLSGLAWLAHVLREHEGEMPPSERARILDAFVESTQQMMLQINELVDSARIQMRQPLALDLRAVDLAALVARVASRLAPAHTIRVAGTEESRQGLYDEVRLGRALSNVLGNAVKYSAPDKEVSCALSFAEETTGTWAVIQVSDHGIGIPAADIAHVFEPYYRAGNARGRAEGTGLGLAGVRQIVAAHGGTVTMQSVEGVGTTVTLRVPHRPPHGDQESA
jgi:PAS domain S-box-containing protein